MVTDESLVRVWKGRYYEYSIYLFILEKKYVKNKLKKEYPECIKCPHLEVENVEKGQVHCFYRVKDKCILKS